MIIPIGFEVARYGDPEVFDIIQSPAADLFVTVKLFDTKRLIGGGFQARVLEMSNAPEGQKMGTLIQMGGEIPLRSVYPYGDYLRELRAAIDEVLGDR